MSKTLAFWDSSALVPAFVDEEASTKVRALLTTLVPVVWWATVVEVHGAICRLRRNQEITESEKQASLMRLQRWRSGWREIVPDDNLRELAEDVLGQYPLRAADALQFAAALIWCQQRPRNRTFITGDQRLAEAAHSAGFTLINLP